MKAEGEEWISISDFMASTIAILIMIVVAILLNQNAPVKVNPHIQKVKKTLDAIYAKSQASRDKSMRLGSDGLSIIFEAGTFKKGCPCLEDTMRQNINDLNGLKDMLDQRENKNIIIEIDGFTDNIPVTHPKTVSCADRKYLISDNLTLSMYRAIEARAYLLAVWNDTTYKNRIIIGGSGAAKLDPKIRDKNRRIIFKLDSVKK